MTLRDTYARFLVSPSKDALAANASLHYISTLTSIHDAPAIMKHFAVQEKLLKKTKQTILDAVEGHGGLSVDVETTIEFNNGGGAYLPGLDDNFVADRTVHIVHFDGAGSITQIRQYWDQGSLLKQIDVIGSRSRNWPIRDGKDQSRLIATNAANSPQPASTASSRPSTAVSRGTDDVSISSRSRGSTSTATNDPHASLSLFAPREVSEGESCSSQPSAPRAQSAKPPPREYSELFVGEDTGSPSPSPQRIPVKAGSGKNFKASRLFDEDTEEDRIAATPQGVKTNAKKYNHFEFGDGEETPTVRDSARAPPKGTKSQPSWNFEDFATPEKAETKTQPQAVRHFGWSDDEETSPVRRPIVHKARPMDPHFDFNDDGTPEAQRKQASTKGSLGNNGQGLYEDHVTHTTDSRQDRSFKGDGHRPLNDVTTAVENKNRSKDFGAHFDMQDNSPGANALANSKLPSHETRSSMNTHWGAHQDSPDGRGINIAGNGMGGRKGHEWSLFEDSPAKKENAKTTVKNTAIKTEGDGMGGRKNAESFWDF
ncbi:hypothetical protein LEMA_P025610.1 [Plenodomus lingam JN3]|uniref:NTF2-like protein n=1 Tax=Leptosphaeria maculans (strain JN3 / isolate v23.1.3 / race Av1-4-5-6-7-8) TaxID=985895 RepID=E4ZXJ9_LEPMJ|nr:hypothetical protein LEMA_P025610.1 [Plenodomus lingam JN3]CBX95409.1 hypothetical protein LEMA_P025610.1 [Plenodomus lingam JN3]